MRNNVLVAVLAASLLAACSSTKNPNPSSASNDKGSQMSAANAVDSERVAASSPFAGTSVYYEYDSAEIRASYRTALGAEADYLASHPDASIVVDGNCDERGSAEYNLSLGQRRADALGKMLVTLGANKKQIKTVSHGKENPKATCHDESCWKENRRADVAQG